MAESRRRSLVDPGLLRCSRPAEPHVIKGIPPRPMESARGYLRRVAGHWSYGSWRPILALAGVTPALLDQVDVSSRIASALRIKPSDWLCIANSRTSGDGRGRPIEFIGKPIGIRHLAYGNPRICIECLREQLFERRLWELSLLTACARHKCFLISKCPRCGESFGPSRAPLHLCGCGMDIRDAPAPTCSEASASIALAIERAAVRASTFNPEQGSEGQLPPEVIRLELRDLLALLAFLGTAYKGGSFLKEIGQISSDLTACTNVVEEAATMLSDWPKGFISRLKSDVCECEPEFTSRSVLDAFGKFYARLFRECRRPEFSFIRDAFEMLLTIHWRGPVHPGQKWVKSDTRDNMEWIIAEDARKTAHISSPERLVQDGEVRGYFVRLKGPAGRRICWLHRSSLELWLRERARLYISRHAAAEELGISWKRVESLSNTGLLRKADRRVNGRHWLVREDVAAIVAAFGEHQHTVANSECLHAGIPLGKAIDTFLDRPDRLAAVLRAVMFGKLVPIGHTSRYSGVAAYIFLEIVLRSYSVASALAGSSMDEVNATGAAMALDTTREAVVGLVHMGMLTGRQQETTDHFNELVIPLTSIQRFSRAHVSTRSFARRLGVSTPSLVRRLKERKLPLLTVPIGRDGFCSLFVDREVAESIREPMVRLSTRPTYVPRKLLKSDSGDD